MLRLACSYTFFKTEEEDFEEEQPTTTAAIGIPAVAAQ
jgi:hypothetical protein